jgi:hypothetical protein
MGCPLLLANYLFTSPELGASSPSLIVAARPIDFSIRPSSTLPITLDLGTNNSSNLSDPLYLGLRQRRPSDAEYDAFMDEFITEMGRVYPKVLVQFEVRSYHSTFPFQRHEPSHGR